MLPHDLNTLWQIALRSVMVYALVLLGVRLTGKRQIGQLTPFDLIVLLLLSNAVQNAMTGSDSSVAGGAVAAATLLATNFVVSRLMIHHPKLAQLVEGKPVVLVENGNINYENLQKQGLTEEILMEVLREHEARDLTQVDLAVLEVDGNVSVIRSLADGSIHSQRKLRHHSEKR